MKAIIAIDSLKGSLSSLQAGDAIREGILRVYKDAVVQVRPLADGGEGTVEALTIGMGGELQTVTVIGPSAKRRKPGTASWPTASPPSWRCPPRQASPWSPTKSATPFTPPPTAWAR